MSPILRTLINDAFLIQINKVLLVSTVTHKMAVIFVVTCQIGIRGIGRRAIILAVRISNDIEVNITS